MSSKAKLAADSLLVRIGEGTAEDILPKEYFPPEQTRPILAQLKNECDIAHGKGVFINDFYGKNVGGDDVIFEIYEYRSKCQDMRFIISYKIMSDKLKLVAIKYEEAKVDNPMILFPERRLYPPAASK